MSAPPPPAASSAIHSSHLWTEHEYSVLLIVDSIIYRLSIW
jgi:hypothetical protein